jgi:DNA-binding transcriptional ArsR family regulator
VRPSSYVRYGVHMASSARRRRTPPVTDPRVLRALAHPVRLRLYEALAVGGPRTVSQLAAELGGQVGTLSYHLRELARYGYLEQADELARDHRERWWRAVPGGVRWSEEELLGTAGGVQARNAMERVALARQVEHVQAWHTARDAADPEWRHAAHSSDTLLRLSASELAALGKELDDVIESWLSRPKDDAHERDRRTVAVVLHAIPINYPTSEGGS